MYIQIEDFGETVITIEFSLFHEHIDHNWTFSFMNSCKCPFNPIFCVKCLPHLSHLYFLKSFMNIFHMHFEIELSNNFFFTNLILQIFKVLIISLIGLYTWGLVLIFSISWKFCLYTFKFSNFHNSWLFCICNFRLYSLAIFFSFFMNS